MIMHKALLKKLGINKNIDHFANRTRLAILYIKSEIRQIYGTVWDENCKCSMTPGIQGILLNTTRYLKG